MENKENERNTSPNRKTKNSKTNLKKTFRTLERSLVALVEIRVWIYEISFIHFLIVRSLHGVASIKVLCRTNWEWFWCLGFQVCTFPWVNVWNHLSRIQIPVWLFLFVVLRVLHTCICFTNFQLLGSILCDLLFWPSKSWQWRSCLVDCQVCIPLGCPKKQSKKTLTWPYAWPSGCFPGPQCQDPRCLKLAVWNWMVAPLHQHGTEVGHSAMAKQHIGTAPGFTKQLQAICCGWIMFLSGTVYCRLDILQF